MAAIFLDSSPMFLDGVFGEALQKLTPGTGNILSSDGLDELESSRSRACSFPDRIWP